MKTLLILRHAKSSWKNSGLADHDRPLNARGQRDAKRMGQFLQHVVLLPDLIITSTAQRAATTAELLALACNYKAEIEYTPKFYLAAPKAYLYMVSRLSDTIERVMVIGHNPGLEELVEQLTGIKVKMPTAALAHIQLPIKEWRLLKYNKSGYLRDHWRPKALPDELTR